VCKRLLPSSGRDATKVEHGIWSYALWKQGWIMDSGARRWGIPVGSHSRRAGPPFGKRKTDKLPEKKANTPSTQLLLLGLLSV